MSTWTDEHLADLLTDTFAAHESDADPAVAQRIALTAAPVPRRRVWLAVAAAVAAIVVIVVVVGLQALRPEVAPEPLVPVPAPTDAGHNRAVASDWAATLLHSAPLPPRASARDRAPAPELRRLPAYIGDVDRSLTRTGWWVVPMGRGEAVQWYATQVPSSNGDAELTWWTETPTSAYTTPAVLVSFASLAPGLTAIRIDVTMAARDDRTAETLVPGDVTSVDVTMSPVEGPGRPPTTVTVTDPVLLRTITEAFNALAGAASGVTVRPCGSPTGALRAYEVVFHWPGHTLAVDAGQPLCGVGRGLTLDGAELAPRVEDSAAFDAVLQEAF